MTRHNEAQKIDQIKNMIDFDENHTNSIKLIAIQKYSPVKLITWCMKRKMFSKMSLTSSVCDVIIVFFFRDENTQKLYEKYNIQKCFLYQNLLDTNSILLLLLLLVFFVIASPRSVKKRAEILFLKVSAHSKILERLDLLDDLWKQFNVQNPKLKRQVDLYEIESMDNARLVTIAVNPK